MKNILYIIFLFFLMIFFIPLAQDSFHLFKIKPLNGAFTKLSYPKLNANSWWQGHYQDSISKYINQNVEIRPSLVRINNQLDFTFYNKSNASKIIVGKKKCLFEDNYINAYTGKDFVGSNNIRIKVQKAVEVQQILHNRGVELIYVFAPGKASYFPEYIPDRFLKEKNDSTNYNTLIQECSEAGLRYIDYNDWFIKMKDTVSHSLYPKCGIHWSYYGMYLVADSLINYIESTINADLPEVLLNGIEQTNKQKDTDYDIGNTLNLLYSIPSWQMSYPSYAYQTEGKYKPNVLVVGDSYYWNMYYSGIPSNVFSNLEFWYYNYQIYNDGTANVASTTDAIDYKSAISDRDVIIIMQTDGGLNNFGLGFFTKALSVMPTDNWSVRLDYYRDMILNDKIWKEHIQEKADELGFTFDEMLNKDANYMVQKEQAN